ncbi:MAG TPA: PhoU domain-containing protein [Thermoanaerobaculia bacterium]|nr:PhoU domain-containing protein [Thermoanaerobaculia bacterium]
MFEGIFGGAKRSPLIESAFDDISEMLQHSARMLDLALAALLDNRPLERDLDEMDDPVDEAERMVRRSVLEHLSFNPRQDLVPSLVLVSMVQDAERIGDFARGIGEIVPLAKSPREGPFADRLREIARELRPLFEESEQAFRQDDPERARRVMEEASELKVQLQRYTEDVAASDLTADMAVVYASAARILRRVGAHLSNISSSVAQPYDRIRHGDEDV